MDPLIFPLLFPGGDLGWSPLRKQVDNEQRASALQFYSYRLAYRQLKKFNPLLYRGRLTQQYIIHAYIVIESTRLDYFRFHQNKLRIESVQDIRLQSWKCSKKFR